MENASVMNQKYLFTKTVFLNKPKTKLMGSTPGHLISISRIWKALLKKNSRKTCQCYAKVCSMQYAL